MFDDSRGPLSGKSLKVGPGEHCAGHPATVPESTTDGRLESDVQLKSRVIKRSIVIGGHRTSVSLEDAFWDGLKDIARDRAAHISDIVCAIDGERQHCNLSSAIRLFVYSHFHR